MMLIECQGKGQMDFLKCLSPLLFLKTEYKFIYLLSEAKTIGFLIEA